MSQKTSMWRRIENLRHQHQDRECLAVIDDLVTMLAAASHGVADIGDMVTPAPMPLSDKTEILGKCMAVICAADLCP